MNCPNCKVPCSQYSDYIRCNDCGFVANPNETTLDQLFAYLSVDPKTGMEGLIAVSMKETGAIMAMVNSNRKILERFRPDVVRAAKETGMNMRLVKFSSKEILEEIKSP